MSHFGHCLDWQKCKNLTVPSVGKAVRKQTFSHAGGNAKWNIWQYLNKTAYVVLFYPEIPFLRIYHEVHSQQ